MLETDKPRFGELPPLYHFILNPYPSERLSKCPFCRHKTGQRKLPLFIHVDPHYPIYLNYTCRYCKSCDLLIAHKHAIEYMLTKLFEWDIDPEVIGNPYLIIGTLEKKAWREDLKQPEKKGEIFPHLHDFKIYYKELRLTRPGLYLPKQKPPIWAPPPSSDWVKR